jgi:PhnB protein
MADAYQRPMGISCYLHPKGGRASEAAEFYKKAFGAEEIFRNTAEDGKRLMHISLKINGGWLLMSDEFPEFGHAGPRPMGGFTIHLQVDDADAWWDRAVAAGCEIRMPLEDQYWGDRYGNLRDPFDVDWSIGGPLRN